MESGKPVHLPETRRGWRPWLGAFFMTSAVFLCGAVVGAVITANVINNRFEDRFSKPDEFIGRALDRVGDELGLSEAQRAELQALVDGHRDQIRGIHEEFRPRLEAEFDALRKGIDAILTPEQAKEWDRRFDEMRKRWLRPRGTGRGRGPGEGRGSGEGHHWSGGPGRRGEGPPHRGRLPFRTRRREQRRPSFSRRISTSLP